MHEENLQWTVIVNYWQSLITPPIISSAVLSYWHHKTIIHFKYSYICALPIPSQVTKCIVVMSPRLSMAE